MYHGVAICFGVIHLLGVDQKVDEMSRTLNRLNALAVKSLPPGKYADGGNLWLNKRADGGGQWFLRVTVHGRRREM